MADMTLCTGVDITIKIPSDGCPLKEKCVRYLTKPSMYQSYMNPPDESGECRYYIPKEGGE